MSVKFSEFSNHFLKILTIQFSNILYFALSFFSISFSVDKMKVSNNFENYKQFSRFLTIRLIKNNNSRFY